jgi:hypothetical protein
MLKRKRGIATVVAAALIIVIIGVSGGIVLYTSDQKSTTTETATTTATVTAPTVTATQTTTAPASTVTATTTKTSTGPTTTVTTTSVATTTSTGPTTTVTSTTTATVTSSIVITTTSTVSGSQTSSGATSTTSTSSTSSSTSSSCTTSTTTTTAAASNATIGLELVQLAQMFPKMSMSWGENSTNGPVVIDSSYVLDYAPGMGTNTYKITYGESLQGFSQSTTAWILSNGTLLATETSGVNSSGSAAEFNLLLVAAPFFLVAAYGSSPSGLVPSSEIQAAGQSTVTLGNLTFSVTNYRADSLPLIFGDCSATYILTTFVLQAGVVPGTSFTLLTYLDMQGTSQSSGSSAPYSIYLKVTSVTA